MTERIAMRASTAVSKCGWICELLRDAGKHGARRKEHEAEMSHGVQKQDGQHDGARFKPGKRRHQIELGRDAENEGAEKKVDSENIHLRSTMPV